MPILAVGYGSDERALGPNEPLGPALVARWGPNEPPAATAGQALPATITGVVDASWPEELESDNEFPEPAVEGAPNGSAIAPANERRDNTQSFLFYITVSTFKYG